ncbi:hypothetical protein H311_05180, partial [Anncaliia algerae PRA109]
ISANIAPGSTITSDKWRGYIGLKKLGYKYFSDSHKYEFIDHNNWEIHAQNIEIRWKYLKKNLPNVKCFALLKKYINAIYLNTTFV